MLKNLRDESESQTMLEAILFSVACVLVYQVALIFINSIVLSTGLDVSISRLVSLVAVLAAMLVACRITGALGGLQSARPSEFTAMVPLAVLLFCSMALLNGRHDEHIDASFANVIAVGFIAPITEEMLFRGIALNRLANQGGAVPAVLLSALLFAVSHASLELVPGAFLSGVVLGMVFLRGRCLFLCMMLHCCINLMGFVVLPAMVPLWVSGISLLLTAIGLGLFWRDCVPRKM